MAYALYLQHGMGLEPCPLCVFQRIAVIALGIAFALTALHDPGRIGARVYGLLIALVAVGGGVVAGRHVWLQSLPADRVPECGAGLDYMREVFPLTEVLRQVFTGSGECAEVVWSFLGLSMPAWVLVWMIALGLGGLAANFVLPRRPEHAS